MGLSKLTDQVEEDPTLFLVIPQSDLPYYRAWRSQPWRKFSLNSSSEPSALLGIEEVTKIKLFECIFTFTREAGSPYKFTSFYFLWALWICLFWSAKFLLKNLLIAPWGLPCTLSSVQPLSCPTLWPHGLQHARLPCPSPTPRVYSNSCPLSQWCHPSISSSHPLLLPPSIFPIIRVFSHESVLHIRWPKYWSFSFSISSFNE